MQPVEDQAARAESTTSNPAEELNSQLRRAEHALRRIAFGARASVALRCGLHEDAGEWQQSLCFGKHNGAKQLYLEAGFIDHPESIARSELYSADLETRMLVAKRLPALVEALLVSDVDADAVVAIARELTKYVDRRLAAPPHSPDRRSSPSQPVVVG